MASIPEEIVDRVRNEANIVDVVSDYVRLRRTGKNWLGLCPFHEDRKPSFTVEPVRGIYKCFACGKGGNVFTFLMEKNGWSFPETVRSLAQSLGIDIPEDERDHKQYSENERLAVAVKDASQFYQTTLNSQAGIAAQAYFKVRGLSDETITKFGLGYAPDEWDVLIKCLSGLGYSIEELDHAGLVVRRQQSNRDYDRFRGRAMFPVFTPTGRVAGFGARRMNENPDQPKYINSPESPLYQKSRLLYGLFQAKDSIRRSGIALIVEGYVDVISLHQAGVATAIAPCGTSLTAEHADLLARYATRVVLVFDSDTAGETATTRGIDVLLARGIEVSVLRLPDGEDPDTFVRQYGVKEFERRLGDSTSFLDFLARGLKRSGDLDSPERQATAIRSIVASIALIPDPLKRELYIQKIASDYFLTEGLLVRELALALEQRNQRQHRLESRQRSQASTTQTATTETHPKAAAEQAQATDNPTSDDPQDAESVAASSATTMDSPVGDQTPEPSLLDIGELPPAEVGLLRVLLDGDPLMLEHVFTRLDVEDFSHPLTRQLLDVVESHYVNQRSFSLDEVAMDTLAPAVRDLATLLAMDKESISPNWAIFSPDMAEPNPWKVARDCLIRLRQSTFERDSQTMRERLADPTLTQAEEEDVLRRFREIRAQVEDLKHLFMG